MRQSAIVAIVPVVLALSGCANSGDMIECNSIVDPVSRFSCQDDAMFSGIRQGVVLGGIVGGVSGAVTGGLVAGPHGALVGGLSGAVFGGALGSVAAYINEKQIRANGNMARAQADINADIRADTRKIEQLSNVVSQIIVMSRHQEAKIDRLISIVSRLDMTIIDTNKVGDFYSKTPHDMEALSDLKGQINTLLSQKQELVERLHDLERGQM
jgi:LytS/YehU family sensor histidine kinase